MERQFQVQWSSVASQTGIGAFSIKTDDMTAMEDLRANIRGMVLGNHCFESFPGDALLKKYGLTIYFPQACAHMEPDLLIEVLRECNPGLKGTTYNNSLLKMNTNVDSSVTPLGQIETIDCKVYKETNPNVRRQGVKIISFTGDEAFLDSLHSFPANFPFRVKLANCYIRGGDRVKERYAGTKPQRPKMAMSAVRELLRRNSTTITNEALDEEERLASNMRNTNLAGNVTPPLQYSRPPCIIQLPHRSANLTRRNTYPDQKMTDANRTTTRSNTGKPTVKPVSILLYYKTIRAGRSRSKPMSTIRITTWMTAVYNLLFLLPGYAMDNAIEAMDLMNIKPNLIVTTRADHLPMGWDSHLFSDPDIFTDFSTDRLEFTLLKAQPGSVRAWQAPSDHETKILIRAVQQRLPHQLINCFSTLFLTDSTARRKSRTPSTSHPHHLGRGIWLQDDTNPISVNNGERKGSGHHRQVSRSQPFS